jgi:hypothetical protein
MALFDQWCEYADVPLGNHHIRLMTGRQAHAAVGVQATAAVVPTHYAAEERIAHALQRLGKPAAAQLIIDSLPQTAQIRSGDLGEIYATEWINGHSGGYRAPIKRLRWKDHRNMAMRGDDVIGMAIDPATQRLRFPRVELLSIPKRWRALALRWTRTAACRLRTRWLSSPPGCLTLEMNNRLSTPSTTLFFGTAFQSTA